MWMLGEGLTYELYAVSFRVPGTPKPKLLYEVNVGLNGRIDDVADVRDAVPLHQ
jgi:hypothetical protein